jgi:multiple sugar transport system permease protein
MIPMRFRDMSRMERRRLATGLFFVSPWLIGFLAFKVYPIVASFYYGFTFYDIIRAPRWLGLRNFQDLAVDRQFRIAVSNTAYYAILAVPSSMLVAYLLAFLLNRRLYGRSVLRTVFYLPTIVPTVSSAMLWLWILDTRLGLINTILASMGMKGIPFLSHPSYSKPSLILMNLWYAGNSMVIFLAALQDVPQVLYDSAKVDGASWLRQLIHVTIPMTTPAILFTLITGLIGASQTFSFAYILTNGGPVNSTLFYALYLYRTSFTYLRLGYASAMAWILFIIIVIFTYGIFKTSGRWVFYSSE